MSQQNVEIVRAMLVATGPETDRDEWLEEFFDPEIEWQDTPTYPSAGVHYGHDALRRHAAEVRCLPFSLHKSRPYPMGLARDQTRRNVGPRSKLSSVRATTTKSQSTRSLIPVRAARSATAVTPHRPHRE